MKINHLLLILPLFFFACSSKPKVMFETLPNTHLYSSSFEELPAFEQENISAVMCRG